MGIGGTCWSTALDIDLDCSLLGTIADGILTCRVGDSGSEVESLGHAVSIGNLSRRSRDGSSRSIGYTDDVTTDGVAFEDDIGAATEVGNGKDIINIDAVWRGTIEDTYDHGACLLTEAVDIGYVSRRNLNLEGTILGDDNLLDLRVAIVKVLNTDEVSLLEVGIGGTTDEVTTGVLVIVLSVGDETCRVVLIVGIGSPLDGVVGRAASDIGNGDGAIGAVGSRNVCY